MKANINRLTPGEQAELVRLLEQKQREQDELNLVVFYAARVEGGPFPGPPGALRIIDVPNYRRKLIDKNRELKGHGKEPLRTAFCVAYDHDGKYREAEIERERAPRNKVHAGDRATNAQ